MAVTVMFADFARAGEFRLKTASVKSQNSNPANKSRVYKQVRGADPTLVGHCQAIRKSRTLPPNFLFIEPNPRWVTCPSCPQLKFHRDS